ncbi:MmcQ/YjbR family DNA-binding protein [Dactylosporangium sucinum]|uniref:YjbR protein n=1 Tax=Dactylosporangium sucinum TaxID=1424081 RepID=A0A917U9L7_9ACTN|nr:MmcQ/YjbR family DNA-binding protein [Dactylosporangium sucinum]GGM67821.1 hypothetical protein GCM10007977_082030 [Dactylosporangium sucinum]
MTDPDDVPDTYLSRLRAICGALPETQEQPAWIGTRWRVRQKTIAHVYMREDGCVVTFRSPGDEIAGLLAGGPPFAKAEWGTDVVVMTLSDDTDWEEVAELLTESYRVQAPKRLAQHL